MAVGTGAKYAANLPVGQPYEINPPLFNKLTQRAEDDHEVKAWPGFGARLDLAVPKADIVAGFDVIFEGNLSGATSGTVDPYWGYNLLKDIVFRGPGKENVHDAWGLDFHALRFIRNPALKRSVEFFSTAPDENGDFRVKWHLPIATDMTSLACAMWAQSQSQYLTIKCNTATAAELDLSGSPVITGNFSLHRIAFNAPIHPDKPGTIVIPDLSRLHSVIAKDIPFANTGDVNALLDPLSAILLRTLIYVDKGGTSSGPRNPVDYAQTSPEVTKLVFKYGAKTKPEEWDPAWQLAARNAEHYSEMLPKGYLCHDRVRENGPRDTLIMPGVVDPAYVPTIRAGTTLTSQAKVHLVQEMQYIG